MVNNRKIISFIFIILSYGFSQGRMNGFGIGHYYNYQGTKNAIDGISWLTPSFSNNVSLSNPSTWHNLNFTYLSVSYSGSENILGNSDQSNGYSGLSGAAWLIPIKSKSSIGLMIEPYSDQRINLVNQDTSYFNSFDTTFSYVRAFNRSGGILSLKIGSSYKINKKISFGFYNNILFGSSRQSESLSFDGSAIIQTSRMQYNGLLNELFLSLALFEDLKIFTNYTYTLKPLEGVLEEKHLFDDTNKNGYHDYSPPLFDFPLPDSVSSNSQIRIKNLHVPRGLNFGILQYFKARYSLSLDFGIMEDNWKQNNSILSPIKNRIISSNYIKFSFTKYPKDFSLSFFDKLSFNTGFVFYNHKLDNNLSNITEFGYSFSLGFKFKPLQNHFGISYYYGNRSHSDIDEKELVQQIQLGISIADIWFIKRRQK